MSCTTRTRFSGRRCTRIWCRRFRPIRRVIAALGIPALGCESFEADDVLATVARMTDERGGRCFLVTGDKDCRQLITDRVKVYNIRKNELFDAARFGRSGGSRRGRWSISRRWWATRSTTCRACR